MGNETKEVNSGQVPRPCSYITGNHERCPFQAREGHDHTNDSEVIPEATDRRN